MDLYVLILRLAHIVGGVFWVGSAFMMIGFVSPAARGLGPMTGRFFELLIRRQRFATAIAIASFLTVVSGILLYLRDSNGLQPDWITSPVGLGFGIGGVAGIAAMVLGAGINGPTSKRMLVVGDAIAQAGGPPSAEALAEIEGYQRRLDSISKVVFVLLSISVVLMAVARYLG